MAKYDVMMGCGHNETVELFGKHDDRERKIKYYKEYGLCRECYRKKMEEEAKKEGFLFHASALPEIDRDDGSILLTVWFSGDTRPHKDEIKSLGGYRWQDREAAADWYSYKAPLCWNKRVKLQDLEGEVEKAKNIGATMVEADKGLFSSLHFKMAEGLQKEWNEKNESIRAIPRPHVPDVLEGRRWNQKIYGKPGSFSVYLDGGKVPVTDGQAAEIEQYLKEKEEYEEKVEQIKSETKI